MTGGKQSQLLVQLTWTVLSDWTGVWQKFQGCFKNVSMKLCCCMDLSTATWAEGGLALWQTNTRFILYLSGSTAGSIIPASQSWLTNFLASICWYPQIGLSCSLCQKLGCFNWIYEGPLKLGFNIGAEYWVEYCVEYWGSLGAILSKLQPNLNTVDIWILQSSVPDGQFQ